MSEAMNRIERLCAILAHARSQLGDRVTQVRDDMEAIKRKALPLIRNSVGKFKSAEAELRAEIEAHPELFAQPKTRVLHGIRVGYMKQRGRIEWDDADAVVAAIERMYGADAEQLLAVTKKPLRNALANLPAKDLKRLGVAVTDDSDVVVIKPADGDVEKLLDALCSSKELEDLAG